MADEADSGTEQQQNSLKGTIKIKKCEDDDSEKITVSSNSINNYENSQDGIQSTILRCERCDKFETHSPSLLLVHSVQCATQQATATSSATAGTGTSSISGIGVSGGSGKGTKSKRHHDGGDGENDTLDTSTGSTAAATTTTSTTNPANENSNDQSNNKTANSNRKLFECDVCNMKFSNGANMRRHKMRHTGVKPYECRVCQKRFFRKDHLAEHFTTHTKTLPYHCPICNRGFQRQIAMRAHFQNEHVGQHDLVKTCPLCSYRAGTMKSLRVHFYNRHGIDLDNPGPGAPSSLLLALDPQNTGQYLPPNISATTTCVPTYSDSGDSLRSNDNATPPMHFLTPHVEISMAENVDSFNADTGLPKTTSSLDIKPSNGPNGISPSSPQSVDSNSNVPSSTHSTLQSLVQSSRNSQIDSHITPSISLIPIKQEPSNEDYSDKNCISNSGDHPMSNSGVSNSSEPAVPTSSLTSIIKVSPLKSLLREDLKRRICARANTRAARNLSNNAIATNNYLNSTNLQSAVAVVAAAAAASSSTSSSIPTSEISAGIVGGSVTNSIGSGVSGGIGVGNCNTILNSATTSTNGMITSTASHDPELLSLSGVRNSTNINKKYLQCLFCGIEFPDQTLYFLHKGCHSDSNPWKCNICGEQCNNVYEFNSHLLSKSHQ